jgi:hypothetical protein
MQTYDEFLTDGKRCSRYVEHKDFESLYLRYTHEQITIANVTAKVPGTGAFTRLVNDLHARGYNVRVESVLSERFARHLRSRGWYEREEGNFEALRLNLVDFTFVARTGSLGAKECCIMSAAQIMENTSEGYLAWMLSDQPKTVCKYVRAVAMYLNDVVYKDADERKEWALATVGRVVGTKKYEERNKEIYLSHFPEIYRENIDSYMPSSSHVNYVPDPKKLLEELTNV